MKITLLSNIKIFNKHRIIILALLISILLFLNQMNLINKLLSNNNVLGNVDSIEKFKTGIISLVYIFQFIITFITIGLETFLICIITKILYKKTNPLKVFLEPIMISNIMCLIVNYSLLPLFGTFQGIEELKFRSILSPANVLQPIVICYFLSKKNIIPKTIIDWLKTGVIYIVVICVPAIILFVLV